MSREADLYKDKIEVSLDGRQIFYLFFGGAVIVGLVFVLGVMVGRRVEARGHIDRARVAATVDPLAALDRLEGGGGLSFQGTLRGGDAPVSDVEKQIAGMKKVELGAPPAPVVDKKADAPKAPPVDVKVEKADDKKSEDKKAEKSDDKKTAEKSDDKKSEKTDEKKPKYTLQLSSFQDRAEAQTYLESIKSSGYQAYVTEGSVDGKQYFRVRMGSYRSMDSANEAKAELEQSIKKSAIVTKL